MIEAPVVSLEVDRFLGVPDLACELELVLEAREAP
jgi:hypothetical protein